MLREKENLFCQTKLIFSVEQNVYSLFQKISKLELQQYTNAPERTKNRAFLHPKNENE